MAPGGALRPHFHPVHLLQASRQFVAAPAALAAIVSDSDADRIRHSYGQSFPDIARAFLRQFPEPPDLVAWPETADQVRQLVDWAGGAGVAAPPRLPRPRCDLSSVVRPHKLRLPASLCVLLPRRWPWPQLH